MKPFAQWTLLCHPRVTVDLIVEFRDLWVGLYWTRASNGLLHLYVGGPVLVFHAVL